MAERQAQFPAEYTDLDTFFASTTPVDLLDSLFPDVPSFGKDTRQATTVCAKSTAQKWSFICVDSEQILNKLQGQRYLHSLPEDTVVFISPHSSCEAIAKGRPYFALPSSVLDKKTKAAELRREIDDLLGAHHSATSCCFIGSPQLANRVAEHEGIRGMVMAGLWASTLKHGSKVLSLVELPKTGSCPPLSMNHSEPHGVLTRKDSIGSLETTSHCSEMSLQHPKSQSTSQSPKDLLIDRELMSDEFFGVIEEPELPLRIETVGLIAKEHYSVRINNLTTKSLEEFQVRSQYGVLATVASLEPQTTVFVRVTVPTQVFVRESLLKLQVCRGRDALSKPLEVPLCTLSFVTGSDALCLRNNSQAVLETELELDGEKQVVTLEPAAESFLKCDFTHSAVVCIDGVRVSNVLSSLAQRC